MTLLEREIDPGVGGRDATEEALIREARRLRRRRWLIGSALTGLAVGAGVAGFLVGSGPPSRDARSVRSASAGSSAPPTSASVPTRTPDLIQPTTLAALPDGNLLILDSSRDQILELRPNGDLSVFAGTGRLGFSGDGGPARDAALKVGYFSAADMAVRPDGSVDVLDDGNCRIRQISAEGTIRTILRIRPAKTFPRGTVCAVSDFAVSPAGTLFIATNSEIERVSSSGRLLWVAGSHGSGPYLTRQRIAFYPDAMAFSKDGDLYIWNESPKVVFRLTPTGKLIQLAGESYDTQLTSAPGGMVFAGGHEGEIQELSSGGARSVYDVNPRHVAGIHWGRDEGFQENGIAVTKSGTIYVDNARGNGWGAATVLVRISSSKHASLAPIRTPLTTTLPPVDTPGFPASLYPPARGSNGSALSSCPSEQGLTPFTARALARARAIARNYESTQFAADITVTDRSWWASDFDNMARGGGFGTHTVTGEVPAARSPMAARIKQACGPPLLRDSIAVAVGRSGYSDFAGTLYLLDRNGHPLVYDVR